MLGTRCLGVALVKVLVNRGSFWAQECWGESRREGGRGARVYAREWGPDSCLQRLWGVVRGSGFGFGMV
jgi:hypothetical protein